MKVRVAELRERDIYKTIFKVVGGLVAGVEDLPAVPSEDYQRLLALLRAARDVASDHVHTGEKNPQKAFPFMREIRRA